MKVLVQNRYFPKLGKEKEVYALRLHASEVRAKLGAPRGRVFKEKPDNGEACVVWECEYPSQDARIKDVRHMKESIEFTKIRKQMRALLERFERTVREIE